MLKRKPPVSAAEASPKSEPPQQGEEGKGAGELGTKDATGVGKKLGKIKLSIKRKPS